MQLPLPEQTTKTRAYKTREWRATVINNNITNLRRQLLTTATESIHNCESQTHRGWKEMLPTTMDKPYNTKLLKDKHACQYGRTKQKLLTSANIYGSTQSCAQEAWKYVCLHDRMLACTPVSISVERREPKTPSDAVLASTTCIEKRKKWFQCVSKRNFNKNW